MSKSFAIDPRAYSGGTVAIHAPNYAGYFQQAMAHRMAKQQALSQYYDRVQTSINPQGVRDQDLEGWQKKADDWNKWGIEHRDELVDPRRDGGQALNRFNSMHRDLLGDLAKSKQAASKELALQRIYSDPAKAKLATDKDLTLAHSLSASIYDPQHYQADGVTPHDLSEFSFNAAPYDTNKQRAVTQMLNRGLKKDRVFGKPGTMDPATRLTQVPYTEKHSTQNLKAIGDRMGDAYDGDPSIQAYYQHQELQPDQYDRLNKAYQGVYGANQDIGTDFKKHAQADQILQNSQQDVGAEMRSVPQPRVGRSGGVAGQQYQDMVNWVKGTAGAIRSGNEGELKRFGSQLFQGSNKNSTYQDVDYGPFQNQSTVSGDNPDMNGTIADPANIKQGAIFHHKDHQYVYDIDKTTGKPGTQGQWKDVNNTTNFDAKDPYLEQKLTGYYQTHFGKVAKLAQTPFYQQTPDDDEPGGGVNPNAPASAPAPPTAINPDDLIKRYQPKQ
jgi:hypothetical protein